MRILKLFFVNIIRVQLLLLIRIGIDPLLDRAPDICFVDYDVDFHIVYRYLVVNSSFSIRDSIAPLLR